MSDKRFHVIVKRTYTTSLTIEAPSKEYLDDVINSEDHVEQRHLDDFYEVLNNQELEQMDVEINDWEAKELVKRKSDLIID
tara:strand:+ start:130 stop:372 length:243 start_codon:yes stop_codon:yes gene_type:complete